MTRRVTKADVESQERERWEWKDYLTGLKNRRPKSGREWFDDRLLALPTSSGPLEESTPQPRR